MTHRVTKETLYRALKNQLPPVFHGKDMSWKRGRWSLGTIELWPHLSGDGHVWELIGWTAKWHELTFEGTEREKVLSMVSEEFDRQSRQVNELKNAISGG